MTSASSPNAPVFVCVSVEDPSEHVDHFGHDPAGTAAGTAQAAAARSSAAPATPSAKSAPTTAAVPTSGQTANYKLSKTKENGSRSGG